MRFTVAITVWKREHLLPHAIQSVLAQTYSDWELVVYSDGRSRATEKVVGQLADEIPVRYRRLPRRPRFRGNHLRRAALEDGTGSHVCIVGHDCVLYPTYLETHARATAGDRDALPVVPVAYWKELTRRPPLPAHHGLTALGESEIDLLCLAFPRRLALQADCFGSEMLRHRHADFLSFDALRRLRTPVLASTEEQAAHF